MNKDIDNGEPIYFNIETLTKLATELVSADEPLMAIELLEKFLPSYYRENIPQEVTDLKYKINSHLANVVDYANYTGECYPASEEREKELYRVRNLEMTDNPVPFNDMTDMIDIPFCQPRGTMLRTLVASLNEQNLTPHIVEMGPAHFWVPFGLNKYKLDYTYAPLTVNILALNSMPKDLYKKKESGDINIFICFETIEHLYNEIDIFIQYSQYERKHNMKFDMVMISTPKNTFFGGVPMLERDIEHVRTYNPKEFMDYGKKHWPNYIWSLIPSQMMVLFGSRSDSKHRIILQDNNDNI